MRAGILWLPFLALGSCSSVEPAEIKQCEDYLVAKLKAPATYKRIEASSFVDSDHKPPRQTVIIQYDAVNSYNAPIRDMQVCQFAVAKGRPDTGNYIDFDGESEEEVDNMMAIDGLTNL